MTSNFLDNACTKIQNMAFKASKMDQIALEYWYYGFLGRLRVDERGFFTKSQSRKNVHQSRNQDAAHAQKSVTVPLKRRVYESSRGSSLMGYTPASLGLSVCRISFFFLACATDETKLWVLTNFDDSSEKSKIKALEEIKNQTLNSTFSHRPIPSPQKMPAWEAKGSQARDRGLKSWDLRSEAKCVINTRLYKASSLNLKIIW